MIGLDKTDYMGNWMMINNGDADSTEIYTFCSLLDEYSSDVDA